MILKPLAKSINEGWTPQHLFQGTDLGLWYDISDRSTLFQDSDGSTPVTDYGQPVGLILDKSTDLQEGAEIIHDVNFKNGSAGWGIVGTDSTHTVDFLEQGVRVKVDTVSNITGLLIPNALTIDAWYIAEVYVSIYVSGQIKIANDANRISKAGYHKFIFRAQVKDVGVMRAAENTDVTVSMLSVRPLTGHHASQPTTTKRAIYARMPRVGVRNLIDNSDNPMEGNWAPTLIKTPNQLDMYGGYTAVMFEGPSTATPTTQATTPESGAHTFTAYIKRHPTRTTGLNFLVRNNTKGVNYTNGSLNSDGAGSGTGWSFTPLSNGFIKIQFTTPSDVASGDTITLYFGATGSTKDTYGIIVQKAQLEAGTVSTLHQTRVSKYDVYEQGQVHVDYLEFDGVDDWYTVSPAPTLGSEETKSASVSKISAQSIVLTGDSRGYLGFLAANTRVYSNVYLDGVPGTKPNLHGDRSTNKVGILRKSSQRLVLSANTGSTEYLGQITDYYSVINNFGAYNFGATSPTKGNIHQALAISRFITDEETNLLTKYLGSKAGVTEYVES